MSIQAEIGKTLKELAIPCREVKHPAVFTVAESLKYLEDKRPIKNLLLQEKGKGRKVLVIMGGDTRLDLKKIEQELGIRKLSFAKEDVLYETLGVMPGAVSIFGLLHDGSDGVEVILEENLLDEKELGFHPNTNTSTIFVPGTMLFKIVKHTGHKLHVLNLHS
jgi:Ala-tRNA(Pro) deacylase